MKSRTTTITAVALSMLLTAPTLAPGSAFAASQFRGGGPAPQSFRGAAPQQFRAPAAAQQFRAPAQSFRAPSAPQQFRGGAPAFRPAAAPSGGFGGRMPVAGGGFAGLGEPRMAARSAAPSFNAASRAGQQPSFFGSLGNAFGDLTKRGDRPISMPAANRNYPGIANVSNRAAWTSAGLAAVAGSRQFHGAPITAENLHSQAGNIRNSFIQYNHNFNGVWGPGSWGQNHQGWWNYPGSWYPSGWSPATAWAYANAAALNSFLGCTIANSLANVIYDADSVLINGQPYCSAEQYYQQAMSLALNSPFSGGPEQWQPLGVFGLGSPGQTQSTMIFQLAIDQYGMVRGNYMNQITGETEVVSGCLDRATQRLTWVVGPNTGTVFDTYLYALLQPESSIFVHYGPLNTQQMIIVRLPQPPDMPMY